MTGLPASTAPAAAAHPLVQGRCPACNGASLFLGSGGHVTCSRLDCPDPTAADDMLHCGRPEPSLTATEATGHVYLSTGCHHGNEPFANGLTGHEYCQNKTGILGAKHPARCKSETCRAPCICHCHTTPAATEATDAGQEAAAYTRAVNAPPSAATCAAIKARIESGDYPHRTIRKRTGAADEPARTTANNPEQPHA